MPGCAAEACDRQSTGGPHGYCLMHYKRWKRRGTVHDITPEHQFFNHVEERDGCWIWTASKGASGYGKFCLNKKTLLAHRWVYEFFVTEIPDGLHLDHLCRNPSCVNPWHLEPVSPRANLLRSSNWVAQKVAQTECKRGHPFDAKNTYVDSRGRRGCRCCRNAANQRSHSRRAASAAPTDKGEQP